MNAAKLSITNQRLLTEITTRGMIIIFMFLVYSLNKIIAHPVDDQPLKLVIYSLLDLVAVVIVPLLFQDKKITRDTNELNLYSMIFHLIYIPFYNYGIEATYHNWAIRGLLIIFAVRVLYFGAKTSDGDFKGFPTFGGLGLFRLWRESHNFTFKFCNHLPSVLFFGAAAPLWFISYRSNDTPVTMTVVALMMFVFFVATKMNNQDRLIAADQAAKNRSETQSEKSADVEALVKIFNARSAANKALILDVVTTAFSREDNPISRRNKEVMAKFEEHYYFPIGRLMQLLPGDITNQRTLTPEQAEMCLAVSRFSEKAKAIIEEGIITIEQLQFMAMESLLVGPIPECKELMAYLEAQLDFMEESMIDYGAAAEYIKQVPKSRK